MIADDFKIDFENKKISYNPKGGGRIYTANELYSYLMDTFDEPINMQYAIPIKAKPGAGRYPAKLRQKKKTKYFLVNGWTIDQKGKSYLTGILGVEPLKVPVIIKRKAKKIIVYNDMKPMIIIDINGNERKCAKAYPDPSYPGFIKVEYVTPRRSYNEWYPINDFLAKNPNLADLIKEIKPEAPEINGIATSTTKTSLTDKTQKWKRNAYAGFPVWIARGQGEGQVRTVTSNTKDTLVIDKNWETKPNKFSEYVLSRNIHKHMTATGNQSQKEMQYKYEKVAKKMERERKKAQSIVMKLKDGN
ncbi:MAG: hypothetical protein Q8P29_01230 [Candidatus Levybacteria bacterium]|nr:hypothetical protein [Candidatus Levybacteria bacterium]